MGLIDSRMLWLKAAGAAFVALNLFVTPAVARPIKLVALGDSITAGLGLKPGDTYVDHLQTALRAKGLDVEIANAGVSGDTSSDGLDRVDWSVPDGTDGVILALGANDMLRGIDPAITVKALTEIVTKLKAHNVDVLLVGMLAPANLGEAYRVTFNRIFPDLAAKQGLDLYPFLLQGVARRADLNQDDGIHPNAKGAAVLAEAMLPAVLQFALRIGKK